MWAPKASCVSPRAELVVRTALIVTTILVVVGLARLLIQITDILLIALIAAILATGVAPLADAVERQRWGRQRRRMSRPWAIGVVFVVVILLLLVITTLLVTPVVIEAQQFLGNLPARLDELQRLLLNLQARNPWLPDLAGLVQRLPQELSRLSQYFGPVAGVAFRFLGGIASVITVLFLAFYMLVEGPTIKAGFLSLFPRLERRKMSELLDQIGAKFGGWLRGQLLLGAIIGLAAGIGVAVIGLPFPVLLGIFAGITELIPMMGPTLGAIPAVFLSLFQPTWKIIAVIIWYAFIQQAEANFVVPRVMRHAVGLSPLLTILALIIGAKLLGLAGALLAIPVAAALQVVVGEILRRLRPES